MSLNISLKKNVSGGKKEVSKYVKSNYEFGWLSELRTEINHLLING